MLALMNVNSLKDLFVMAQKVPKKVSVEIKQYS